MAACFTDNSKEPRQVEQKSQTLTIMSTYLPVKMVLKGSCTLVKFVGKTVGSFVPQKGPPYLPWPTQIGFITVPSI